MDAEVVECLETYNLFSSSQFSFRRNHSTIEAVLTVLSGLLEGLDPHNRTHLFRATWTTWHNLHYINIYI